MGGSERMRISSSGNVGIGDSSPSVKLDVYQSTAGIGTVDFRHVNGNRILINPSYNYHDAYNHIFRGLNGTSTHMTIDNSGNLLVGMSSSNYAVAGSQLGTGGNNFMTRSGAQPLLLNRLSNDGDIVLFMKDSAPVGSIGSVDANSIKIGKGNSNLRFYDFGASGVAVIPCTSTGVNSINVVDLGNASSTFKDFHLSGSVVAGIGATNAATLNAYSKTVSTNLPSALRVIENTTASSYWDIGSTGGASNNLNFYANANTTPKMTLSGAGNVGIGVTPNASARLHIGKSGASPELWLERTDGYLPTKLIGNTLGNGQGFKINVAGTDSLAINSSGNVMVGTTSVGGAGITVGKQYGGIDLTGGGGTFANWGGAYGIYARSNVGLGIASVAGISFETAGGNERMRIDSSGRVGIGISNPNTKLHIDEVPANIVGGNAINGSTMKGIKIETTLNSNESVGLWFGTNGVHWSGISGQRSNSATGWGTDLRFYTHENATADLTYARQRMIIDSEGRLGIGNSAPSEKLHVSGNILATGNITAYSDRNLKENIKPIVNAVEKVQQLNGVTYNRNDIEDTTKRYAGIIAQDLQAVLPEAVEGDSILRVDYNATIGLLIEAIKELKTEVDDLKSKIKEETK